MSAPGTLERPPQPTLDRWRRLTDRNQHALVRLEISKWLEERVGAWVRSLGYGEWGTRFRAACLLRETFSALALIEGEIGHAPQEFSALSDRKTHDMIRFVRRFGPEAADAIRRTLTKTEQKGTRK